MNAYSAILLFVAVLGFGVWGFIGKIGIEAVGRNQYLFLSYLIVVVILGSLAAVNQDKTIVFSRNLVYPVLGGFFTALAISSFFAVVERVPLSIASTISSISPVITAVLALIFLSEKLTLIQGVGIVFALVGVILLSI